MRPVGFLAGALAAVTLLQGGPSAIAAPIAGGVREVWVARYDGGDVDFAADVEVDAAGNVYVTGSSYATFHDYLTIKYDRNGNELWRAHYYGPGHGFNQPVKLAVDGLGNVYVTGSSENAQGVNDYATVKYGPSGNRLWARRFDSGFGGSDLAYDLTLDPSGNVYVTGGSEGGATWIDYLTIKYHPAGTPQWTARTSGNGSNNDYGRVVRIDPTGNVYVTGEIVMDFTDQYRDIGTVKYDPAGQQLWLKTYDTPLVRGALDTPHAMELDGQGNAVVTGESAGSGPGCCPIDWVTLEYSPAGALLWESRFDGPSHTQDIPSDLAVDDADNVIVTGQATVTTHDIATIKYDSAGNEVWQNIIDAEGFDEGGVAVDLDARGNAYVAANRLDEATDFDWLTLRIDANGVKRWSILYNGPGNFIDTPADIAVDGRGFVYVTGESWGALPDYATIKYAQRRA
ncbi:hypothetical protein BH20ACT24_BH20ACT24_16830 [soil metagenome]